MPGSLVRRSLATALMLVCIGCGTYEPPSARPTPMHSSTPAADVARQAMGSVDPENAEGETLSMTRVTFPPHYRLASHTHPGTQMAFVEEGTLTYGVVRGGRVTIHGPDGSTRRLGPGKETEIETGSWFVENPGLVHYGANDTSGEVVLQTTALFRTGAAPSTERK